MKQNMRKALIHQLGKLEEAFVDTKLLDKDLRVRAGATINIDRRLRIISNIIQDDKKEGQ